jgi:hypothetical protein
MRLQPVILGCACLFVACGGSSEPTTPVTPVVDPCVATPGVGVNARTLNGLSISAVLPRSTDGCITQRLDSHYVYRAPAVTALGRLLVFLPGTGAVAQNYQLILAQAARAGYHAIGITYPNEQAVGTLCASETTSCYAATRLEILTGSATSPVVDVNRANSIENRLIKLLRFMRTAEPAAGWGQYLLTDSTIEWRRLSIAGHSQGGGHALFIAQRYEVFRGSAYASYGDYLPNSTLTAPWVTQPFATPASRLAGFISIRDELISPAGALTTWSTIGMQGTAVNVDSIAAPYVTGQRFVTTATPENPGVVIAPNHNVVVVDVNTPKTGVTLTPAFAEVWRAVSFP